MTGECSQCHAAKRLLVHHINGNHQDDRLANRTSICYRCHNLAHLRGFGARAEYIAQADLPRPSAEMIREQFEQYGPRT